MKDFYDVVVASAAASFLRSLHHTDRPVAKWLLDSLELMSSDPDSGDVAIVSAELDLRRANIGNYKVLYQVQRQRSVVVILSVQRKRGR